MFQLILDKKLNIHGRGIRCKVTGLPGTSHDGKPYYLMIQGGPGFDHVGIMSRYEQFATCFGDKQEDQPHFVYFDPLGCGESDSPVDKNAEYTVDHFTEIAASLVEAIKNELQLNDIDLRVFGESFGGMVAMNLPTVRPGWTLDNSAIRLKQIISSVGLSAPLDEQEILEFIKKHYQNDPSYRDICASVSKLLNANIADKEDYIRHIAITLAPLYSDQNAALFASPFGMFVKSYPMFTVEVAKALFPLTHLALFQRIISSFDQFNYDLQNHFMATHYNDVDIPKRIRQHEEVYRRIAICCIAGDLDYICHPDKNARPVTAVLPNEIACIVFHAKHAHFSDFPLLAKKVNQYLFADGMVDADFLKSQKPAISEVHILENFSEKLSRLSNRPDVERGSSAIKFRM